MPLVVLWFLMLSVMNVSHTCSRLLYLVVMFLLLYYITYTHAIVLLLLGVLVLVGILILADIPA